MTDDWEETEIDASASAVTEFAHPAIVREDAEKIPYPLSRQEELVLIDKMRTGDMVARHALILAELPYIDSRARKAAFDHEGRIGADEFAQRTYVRLLEKDFGDFELNPGARFRHYVAVMISNLSKDAFRREKIRNGLSLDAPLSDGESDSSAIGDLLESNECGIVDIAEQREIVSFILQKLSGLPKRQQEVFERAAMGDTIEEISGALGISYATVKTHNLRARNTLFEALAAHLGGKTFADFTQPYKNHTGRSTEMPNKNLSQTFAAPASLSPEDREFQESLKAARETADRIFSDRPIDRFLFTAIHLTPPEDQMAIADIAEALRMTTDKALSRASIATLAVIENMPDRHRIKRFFTHLEDNFKRHKGRVIDNMPFAEHLVDLEAPGHKPAYEQAWRTLKDKPEHLYIFCAHHLYTNLQTPCQLAEKLRQPADEITRKLGEAVALIKKDIVGPHKESPVLHPDYRLEETQKKEHALHVLNEALSVFEVTGRIITHKDIIAMDNQHWTQAQKKLQADYGLDVEDLVFAWIRDRAGESELIQKRQPGFEHTPLAARPQLTWAKIDNALYNYCEENPEEAISKGFMPIPHVSARHRCSALDLANN